MISYRDRSFCSAFCGTVDCSRRWTSQLQAAAEKWWNPENNPEKHGAPVSFANFAPTCPEYCQPDPENQDHRELNPGEANG